MFECYCSTLCYLQSQHLHQNSLDPSVHLQEVTNFLLGSYEQHIAAVSSEGLATAIVLCLTSCSATTNQAEQQQQQQQVLQAALASLKAVSISSSGQKVGLFS
jgi:ABC-type transporter MlaC component